MKKKSDFLLKIAVNLNHLNTVSRKPSVTSMLFRRSFFKFVELM